MTEARRRAESNDTKTDPDNQPVLEERNEAQQQELRAQAGGDLGTELKGFAKEVAADVKQFPADVEHDARDPERRVDEQQGVPEHPGAEPESKEKPV